MPERFNIFSWLAACVILAGTGRALAADDAEPLRVRGIEGRVAVYALTNTPRDVVTWLPADTVFTVKGALTDHPWVCVLPPEAVSVWIYRELVRDGFVVADDSQIRAGAGMSFRPIASVDSGERVAVRGVYGDWLKIEPPAGILFWVLRDQVEPLATGAASNEIAPPITDVFTCMLEALTNEATTFGTSSPPVTEAVSCRLETPATPVQVAPPPELAGYVLDQIQGQGERVVLKGTLDWAGLSSVSAPFSLVARQTDGDSVPVCLLLAPEITYGPHVGSSVTVEGTRWFVKGSVLPLVIPLGLHVGE